MKLHTTTEHVIEFSPQEVFEALAHWAKATGREEAAKVLDAAAATNKNRRIAVHGSYFNGNLGEVPIVLNAVKEIEIHFYE